MDAEATRPVLLTVEIGSLCPDLVTVDCLARLALVARRQGGRIAVRGASAELRDLVDLAGLDEVLFADSPRLGPAAPHDRRRDAHEPA